MSMNKQSCCYCCIVGEDEFMATLIVLTTSPAINFTINVITKKEIDDRSKIAWVKSQFAKLMLSSF